MKSKGIPQALKPKSLLDYWTIAAFLVAVIQLFLLRGLDVRILLLFLVPPFIAFVYRHASDRPSTRAVAAVSRTLFAAGVTLSMTKDVFPELGGVDPDLSAKHDRILAWYVIVYLMYVGAVLPLVLFIRALVDHRRKRKAEFSKTTCILGLIMCLIFAPAMLAICCEYLGLSPVLDTTHEADTTQPPDSPDPE